MTARRFILLFASAAALTLVMHGSALSASPEDGPAPPTTTKTLTVEPAPTVEKSTTADESVPAGAEITPPPASEQDTAASRIPERRTRRGMTLEERRAHWEQRLQKVRERTKRRHQEVQESMEHWDSYWKTWDVMTPEQKEAVHAIFGPGHQRCAHHARDHGPSCGMPMRPRSGFPEFGRPAGPAFPGPGYGYGPRRARSYPFDWDPAAALTTPRWYPTQE